MEAAATREQYVEMGVGNAKYALNIRDIHEIIKMQTVTEIPNSKPYVKGVINLRGKIVPIVSLRYLFHLPEEESTKASRIVVVNHREDTVGVIVDQVNKVITFSEIQPPPDRVGTLNGAFFAGIGFTPAGLVGILKLDQLLVR
ncbi:chemotaxis protein CheW [Paenibacillus sp.]|uniref:chemotaxis protein CheW n=1 Tax=Paenibacillus sp. TaxID=58172 RepID=UPI002D27C9E0|nr:chemotaxis protein CheW [Paenibacillus sp.]HZG84252.1 chemotaxis protein CheW [Paenibacillus sp.]